MLKPPRIRQAVADDAAHLIFLIASLAEFENLPVPDKDAQQRLIRDGFGHTPMFEAWLAEIDGESKPVGYAFVYMAYSTFLAAPTLFLEDIFVLPEHRKKGIGKALLRHCIQVANERGCGRMEWNCLDWNIDAQGMYEDMGAKRMSDWLLYRMDGETLGRSKGKI